MVEKRRTAFLGVLVALAGLLTGCGHTAPPAQPLQVLYFEEGWLFVEGDGSKGAPAVLRLEGVRLIPTGIPGHFEVDGDGTISVWGVTFTYQDKVLLIEGSRLRWTEGANVIRRNGVVAPIGKLPALAR